MLKSIGFWAQAILILFKHLATWMLYRYFKLVAHKLNSGFGFGPMCADPILCPALSPHRRRLCYDTHFLTSLYNYSSQSRPEPFRQAFKRVIPSSNLGAGRAFFLKWTPPPSHLHHEALGQTYPLSVCSLSTFSSHTPSSLHLPQAFYLEP